MGGVWQKKSYTPLLSLWGDRMIVADANAVAVAGKVYTTVQGAIDAAAALSPSASNRVTVGVRPGVYTEVVTLAQYVDVIGWGYVRITTSGNNARAVTLASDVEVHNLQATVTSGDGAGGGIHAFHVDGALRNVKLVNCHGYVNPACTSCQGGLAVKSSGSLTGEIRDCEFSSNNTGMALKVGLTGTANAAVTTTINSLTDTRLVMLTNEYIGRVVTCNGKTMTVTSNTATTFTGASWSGGGSPGNGYAWSLSAAEVLRVWNSIGSARMPLDEDGAAGLIWHGGGGTLEVYGSRLRGEAANYSSLLAAGVNASGLATSGNLELYDCDIRAVADSTQVITGLKSIPASGSPVVKAYGCRISAVCGGAGTASAVYTGGAGTPLVTITGGCVEDAAPAGSPYDFNEGSGTLTSNGVIRTGDLLGTPVITVLGTPW